MSKRAVLIDSGCEPTPQLASVYGVRLLGIKVVMDNVEYSDGEEIGFDEFYTKVRRARNIRTRPPAFGEIVQLFRNLKSKGHEELVIINMSSKMTKLVEICQNAGKMVLGLDVTVVDTENVSVGAYLIAEKIIEMLHRGKTRRDVLNALPQIRESSFMQFSVPTLKYLIKNGRIGKARGLVATLLNKKPVLGIDDGRIAPLSTVTGMQKVVHTMTENVVNFVAKRPHNVKLYFSWGFENNKNPAQKVFYEVMNRFEKLGIEPVNIIEGRVWPTVACHSGPEGFAVGVYAEKRPIE